MEPVVLTPPRWVLIVRIFQGLFAGLVLGTSAYGIYWVSFGAWCFALFTALATIIVLLYIRLSTYVASLRAAYNYWAILALEIFMVVFWLASMGALAALRSTFTIPTEINGCVNYGYGGICYKKRELAKRWAVATDGYLNMMSATAAFCAIEFLLFIATLTILSINIRRHRMAKGASQGPPTNDKLEAHPMNPVGYTTAQQQPESVQPQYATQQQQYVPPPAPQPYNPNPPQQQAYPPSMATQQTFTPPPQQAYSPPPQTQSPPPQQFQHQQGANPNQQYHEAPTPNQQYPPSSGQMYQ